MCYLSRQWSDVLRGSSPRAEEVTTKGQSGQRAAGIVRLVFRWWVSMEPTSEAVQTGSLGKETIAMIKQNLKPIEWNDATLELAISGMFTVYRFNQEVPYKLTKTERIQFEQAKERGYVEHSTRSNLRNVFCQWCEIHEEPYVYIKRRGKLAQVVMDLIFLPCNRRNLSSLTSVTMEELYYHVAGPRSAWGTGTYSYIENVDPDKALFIARSYVSIYRRNTGDDVLIPSPYPDPHPDNLFLPRWQETKKIHFARSHTVRDSLGCRWWHFCNAYRLPFIHIHEKRRGYATLEVKMPEGLSLAAQMPRIRLIAQEAAFVDWGDQRTLRNKRWYATDGKTGLSINHPAPIEDVMFFAQSIVDIMDRDGYFEHGTNK